MAAPPGMPGIVYPVQPTPAGQSQEMDMMERLQAFKQSMVPQVDPRQLEAQKKAAMEKSGSTGSDIGSILGGVLGLITGGPMGALKGAQLGGSAGGSIGKGQMPNMSALTSLFGMGQDALGDGGGGAPVQDARATQTMNPYMRA